MPAGSASLHRTFTASALLTMGQLSSTVGLLLARALSFAEIEVHPPPTATAFALGLRILGRGWRRRRVGRAATQQGNGGHDCYHGSHAHSYPLGRPLLLGIVDHRPVHAGRRYP